MRDGFSIAMKRLLTIAAAIGWAAVLALTALTLTPGEALAERRVALVVGNSSYSAVPKLPNPSRDANAVARMFKDAGFETIETYLDVGNLDFKRAIRKFEDTAVDSDIAVLYYAGHGLEIGGTNYLIPIDARLASDRDAPDEAIPLDRLVLSADGAKKLRVIILDACRDNPYAGKMRRESRAALRAVSAGLGKVEPSSTDTLIAYAAKAGSTAEDGDRDHSPFTAALLKHLTVPGLDLRLAFGRVKDEVMKSTNGRQEPFVYGSLGGGNYSLVAAPAEVKGATSGRGGGRQGRLRPRREDRFAQGVGGFPHDPQDRLLRRPRPRAAQEIPRSRLAGRAASFRFSRAAAPRRASCSIGKR